MTDTAPTVLPEPGSSPPPMPPESPADGPREDPNAVPVAQAAPPAPAPKPTIEYHAETDTVLLHYTAPGLDATRVLNLCRADGGDVIGLPEHIDGDHWRIQVRATTQPAQEA